MDANHWMAQQFESNRAHLRAVAYRMLGSLSEADDALQQAWLKVGSNEDPGGAGFAGDGPEPKGGGMIDNLGGFLTTVVARVCLDMLRAREKRREEPVGAQVPEAIGGRAADAEQEALLADSVGLALLVVLDTLQPAERLAFVLHDLFAMPFEEIAPLVGRSEEAARQLASRARRRVQGAGGAPAADRSETRAIVDAFLAASRSGDFDALLAVLDPDVVVRSDATVRRGAPESEVRGAQLVAARAIKGGARAARPALIDGSVGAVVAPRGRLLMVLLFTVAGGRIVEIEAVGDPERLRALDLAILDG
jgi:RNA polymerase sigma-70 factor (ECF subfamily)